MCVCAYVCLCMTTQRDLNRTHICFNLFFPLPLPIHLSLFATLKCYYRFFWVLNIWFLFSICLCCMLVLLWTIPNVVFFLIRQKCVYSSCCIWHTICIISYLYFVVYLFSTLFLSNTFCFTKAKLFSIREGNLSAATTIITIYIYNEMDLIHVEMESNETEKLAIFFLQMFGQLQQYCVAHCIRFMLWIPYRFCKSTACNLYTQQLWVVRSLKAYVFAPYLRLISIQFPALKTKQEWKLIETKERMTSKQDTRSQREDRERETGGRVITNAKAAFRMKKKQIKGKTKSVRAKRETETEKENRMNEIIKRQTFIKLWWSLSISFGILLKT